MAYGVENFIILIEKQNVFVLQRVITISVLKNTLKGTKNKI